MTKLLSRQNYVCRDKSLVATNICHDQHVFVTTKVLSRQAYFCHDKRRVLLRQPCVCHEKNQHVATKLLTQQNYVCRDKSFVVTKICHDKSFVTTNIHLSRQKTFLRQTNVRRDKTFVATKIILVAARANDSYSPNFHYTKLTRTVLLTVTTSSDRRSNGLTRVLALIDHLLVTVTLQL